MHDAGHDPRFDLDPGQYEALREHLNPQGMGPDFALACNVESGDHVHVRRIGPEGSRFEGRVAVMTHGDSGQAIVYVAAPQARTLAAAILTAADELDGDTPLGFFPRQPIPEADLDEPTADVDVEEDLTVVPAATPSLPGLLVGLATLPARVVLRRLL